MKRINYVLGVLLLLSVSLNIVYEFKTHKIKKNIHQIVHSSNDAVPSEKTLTLFNNQPLNAFNGIYNHDSDSTISMVFLGNSLTLHAAWEKDGDQRSRGMAATTLENDYVHQLLRLIANSYHVNIQYSITNIANLERGFVTHDFNMDSCLQKLDIKNPDILILQIGENVPLLVEKDSDKLKDIYEKIFEYYPLSRKFVTLPFWLRPDENYLITEVATKYGAIVVDLSHLGADSDTNFASSYRYYKHAGIGMHPGDEGMLNISNCFFSAIRASMH